MSKQLTRRAFTLGTATTMGLAAMNMVSAQTRSMLSSEDFAIADVPRGEKHFAYVNVVRNAAGNVDVPVGVINGHQEGPTIVITGGIFGTEYCGIEAASRLYRELDPMAMKGRAVIVPVVNMPAFQFRSSEFNLSHGNNPIDGKSINTVFPGNPDGSVSEVIAHFVFEKLIKHADYFMDLRGGDLPEHHLAHTMFASAGSERIQKVSREMALACGFPYHQSRSQRPGSLFWESCNANVPAIITQSGLGYKTQPEEEYIQNHIRGVTNVMKHFTMLNGGLEADTPSRELSSEFVVVKSQHSGVFHATRTPGDLVRNGESVGKITELDGSLIQDVRTKRDGVLHTYFIRRVVMANDSVAYVVPLV